MTACHNYIGHLGIERCLDLLKDRFYWPNMGTDIEECTKTCDQHLKFKTNIESRITPYNGNSPHGANPYGLYENLMEKKSICWWSLTTLCIMLRPL